MTSVDQLNVENIVKNSGSSFYWGMKLLPEIEKRAMFSVYAFCRVVDDIADNYGTVNSKKIKLNNWKKKINGLYKKKKINESILKELKASIKNFDLEKKDFTMVDGMIPLGSCTMKYNDIESVENIFKYDINNHPYQQNDINDNFTKDMNVLKKHLNFLTGFNGISLQPLSGSHAELTALLIMKKYILLFILKIYYVFFFSRGLADASILLCKVPFIIIYLHQIGRAHV